MVLLYDGEVRANNVRLASTTKDKIVGLLFRKAMEDDEALFFPNINSIHTFGMQMNIDVLFLAGDPASGELEVVEAHHDVRPMRSLRSRTADHTLELAAGALRRFGDVPAKVQIQ